MKCFDKACNGEVNLKRDIIIHSGVCPGSNAVPAYPCIKCNRLHWENGQPVVRADGAQTFLFAEKVAFVDQSGQMID